MIPRVIRTPRRLLASLTLRRSGVSVPAMKKRFLIGVLALGILVFAVAGWTLDGVRWAFTPLRPA